MEERVTGVTAGGAAGLRHMAVAYADVDELVDTLAPRIEIAVRRSEPVMVLLDPVDGRGLRDRLGGLAGAVEFADQEAALGYPAQTVVARQTRRLRRLTTGGRRITVVGQHRPEHNGADGSFWIQLDALLNAALASLPVTLLCLYAADPSHPPAVQHALRWNHPELIVEGRECCNPDYRDPVEVVARYPATAPPPPGGTAAAVEFGRGQLARVRSLVLDHARSVGLSEESTTDLVLAVNEVVSNSLEHGAGRGMLRLWEEPYALVCEIRDAGRLTAPFPGMVPPRLDATRGRGLWLARQLCHTLEVWSDTEGTGVRLRMSSA